jgi:hypothetical protein
VQPFSFTASYFYLCDANRPKLHYISFKFIDNKTTNNFVSILIFNTMPKNFAKIKAPIFAIIAAFTLFSTPAIASHYTFGGEMWASSIGNNKYELTHKIYKQCGGIKALDSVFIDAYAGSSASCGTVKFKAGIVSTRYIGTKCSTSNDCAGGVPLNETIYKCTVDLSSPAFSKLLTGTSCKTLTFCAYGYWMSNTTTCKDQDAYFTTTLYLNNLANCNSTTNKAPAMMFDPVRNFQIDRTAVFTQALVDTTEKDILRYQLSPTHISYPYNNKTCSNTPTGDYRHPFTPTCVGSLTCAPNTKTNPVRGTYFDTIDGTLIFCPTVASEIGIIGTRVYEYRINKNGAYTLIAMHTREIGGFVIDLKGKNETPRAITANSVIKICVGNTVSQKFTDFDDIVAPSQSTADSLIFIKPPNFRGASIKAYSSSKTKLAFEFNWKPTINDTFADGYVFPVKVIDQNCNPPMASTCNLIVKVYPTPSGSPEVNYKGCNKLAINIKNFNGGSARKVSWQVIDSSGKTLGTSNKVSDSISLNGTGKYKILALMSNEGGCFKYWDTTISIIDTVINFSLGNKKPIADTLNCPKSSLFIEPTIISARKGSLQFQWFGLPQNLAYLGTEPRSIPLTGLTKIGTNKGITFATKRDTSALLLITDAKGCFEVQQLNIHQVFSDDIQWKTTPLAPICTSDPPLKLIDPTTKDMLDGGPLTGIRCLNGKYLDSLGPNYYKLRAPSPIKGIDKITLNLVASYDTLGCVSRDTNTIDVIFRPQFDLFSTKTICSGDSAFFPEDAVEKPAKNALPYEWKIIGMPSKSIAQLMPLTVNGKTGTYLVTHLDSIAVGTYKLQACAVDSTLGCRACDTTTIVSKPQIRYQYTGDTLFCPNDALIRLREYLKISTGESIDTTYAISLTSVNGNTNPSASVQKIFDKSTSTFNPRAAVGKAIIRIESPKYCYADGEIAMRIQDTLPITFSVSPDTAIRLPKTSFTFTAASNSTQIWWNFGTANPADTSKLNPITWAYDNKIASYRVVARSFNTNGCYGESAKIVNVLDVSAIEQFNLEAKINANLQLISSNWIFEKLEVFNAHGQLVYRSNNNLGVQTTAISPGVYTYKIIANQGPTQVQKTGKWLNFER